MQAMRTAPEQFGIRFGNNWRRRVYAISPLRATGSGTLR